MFLRSINCILFINCLHLALALVCFDCFSTSFGFCGKHFSPSKASRAICFRNESACFVEMTTINGIKVVTRNCGKETKCSNNTDCKICTTTLCNSSYSFRNSKIWYLNNSIILTVMGLYILLRF